MSSADFNNESRVVAEPEEDGPGPPQIRIPTRKEPIWKPLYVGDEKLKGYPTLTFKPLILRDRSLVWILSWYIFFLLGIIIAVIVNNKRPELFHVSHESYQQFWNYLPGILGGVSLTIFRPFFQTVARIWPYTILAEEPREDGTIARVWKRIFQRSASEAQIIHHRNIRVLNLVSNGQRLSIRYPGKLVDLWKIGQWKLVVLTLIHTITTLLLVPLKSSFVRISKDAITVEEGTPNDYIPVCPGWSVNVSTSRGYILIAVYVIMISTLIGHLATTNKKPTGLRWDPATLAAQIQLVQESNALDVFSDPKWLKPKSWRAKRRKIYQDIFPFMLHGNKEKLTFEDHLESIDLKLGTLRLGYWQDVSEGEGVREDGTLRITHGINFTGPYGIICRADDGVRNAK
jgi:hypothetical protein